MKLLGAAKSAHRHEAGVVDELVSKQPRPASGRTTKEEYDEGLRLGAAGNGDGAARTRIEVPDDVLKQVVCALNESSAPGCSLVGYKELKDLYHHGYAGSLKSVVEALLNGEVTGEARVLLSSAKLVALRKPNGKLRPIAMGDALRKLAMTLLCKMHREQFDGFFTAPLKPGRAGGGAGDGGGDGAGGAGTGGAAAALGVAVQLGMSKGGAEIAAKAISTHLELNPTWAAFKNDFSNAFNACARRRMVEQLLKSPFGHFEPAFRLFYEHAGALYFEGERLPADSCEGAQQGDPLGPFIFALAFHATLQQVAAEYADCVFVAYLDDVTVLGPPARAYAALQRLQSLAESQCDLESDRSKCGVFSPAATDAEMDFIPADIEGSPHYVGDKHAGRLRGMVFVGAPVGDDEWVAEELRFIFGKLVSRLPALARMRDAGRLQVATQARTLLLRYCANPRAGFWLRMVPPHLVRRVAATFDDAIEACLRETVCSRGAPDDARWRRALQQARLPMRLGGLGLTSAAGQADAAWCGSWALCWSRMQRFFPALAAVDLTTAAPRAAAAAAAAAAPGEATAPSPRLPSLVSLRDAHARLMARRDEVDTAFAGIDAAAAATPVPRPGRRVPADLAYHPKGLPPAGALPSLTQMADPECKTNIRAQRSFASVAQLGSWLELMTAAAGLDGERGGVKVALRECSRLIGVAQPLASAWLQAIPGPSQFRLRSSLYVIALQRWLGLPIHMASAANVAAAETLGDELLKGCEHTTRHNRVVAAWVRAVQAARGAAHTRATAEAPAWSAPSVPDFVSEYAGQAGAHQAGEVKVYNTIIADAAQLLRGATQAFGATRARLLAANLGDYAPSEVVAPRSDGAARTAKYQAALDGGHDVLVLISEVWGGFSPEAMRFLGELAQARNDGVDLERASATWSTSSFTSYHGQLLSLAVQWGVAIEIERAIKTSARFC